MNGTMFDAVTDWCNLWRACTEAARGKRRKASTAAFEHQAADHLIALQDALRQHTYRPGPYHHFVIHEPKRRRISAAPFADRVVHHFPSLDHAILRGKIAAVVRDEEVRGLIDTILDSGDGVLADEYTPVYFPGDDLFAVNRPRGLPIGNLTSQFWSNVYLNDFDWFVLRELGCGAYLRYVDDFVLFGDDKAHLARCRQSVIDRLARERLTIHEAQAQVLPTRCGIPWLGFVVYPTHRLLKRRNAVNFTRRLSHHLDAYQAGKLSFAELDACVQGWINHVRYADTWGLREHLFSTHPIPAPPR